MSSEAGAGWTLVAVLLAALVVGLFLFLPENATLTDVVYRGF